MHTRPNPYGQIRGSQSSGNDVERLVDQSPVPNSMAMLHLLTRNSSVDRGYFQNMNEESARFSRQESHGNLFTGMVDEPVIMSQDSQSYTILCLEYEKYLFDNRIRMIIKRMSIKAYKIVFDQKDSAFLVFPIQKLLTTISKKLMLNRFELLFLEYVFSETKWNYKIECIIKNAKDFNSFILLPDCQAENADIKYMQIYILYCAYYSKKSLNELPADSILNEFLHEVCAQNYREHFQEWIANSSMPSRINPKMLNTIFKKLTFDLGPGHDETENYCLIVEEVLDISPAYNANKTNKQNKPKRKKKQSVHNNLQPRGQVIEESHQPFSEIVQQESEMELSIPAFKNKKSSFMSNVDPLEPRHYLTRNNSYQE